METQQLNRKYFKLSLLYFLAFCKTFFTAVLQNIKQII